MVREVEQRVESVKALGGASGEGKALVLAALLMADELHDTAIEMASLRQQMAQIQAGAPISAVQPITAPRPDTKRLARIARKAEDIAAGMEPH